MSAQTNEGRLTVGADPEVFVCDLRNGQVQPICGIIGGSKREPLDVGGGYSVHEDNVMLEFGMPSKMLGAFPSFEGYGELMGREGCIIKPMTSGVSFDLSIRHGLQYAAHLLPEHFDIMPGSAYWFSDEQLQVKGANVFGCDGYYDAYLKDEAPRIQPEIFKTSGGGWRIAGGHIHIGFEKEYMPPTFALARFLDLMMYIPMRLQHIETAEHAFRRRSYGCAGAYRDKPYGMEYRTLSNAWVFRRLSMIVPDMISEIFCWVSKDNCLTSNELYQTIDWDYVREAINTDNEDNLWEVYDRLDGMPEKTPASTIFNWMADNDYKSVVNL